MAALAVTVVIFFLGLACGGACLIAYWRWTAQPRTMITVGTMTDKEEKTTRVLYVSGHGERYHTACDCHGLRSVRGTRAVTPCLICT